MDTYKNETGFSLIEVMVALAVLTIGVLALYSMQISSLRGNAQANTVTSIADATADQIEQIMSLPYDDPLLTDFDGDGIAGLADTLTTPTPTPDHSVVSADGRYTIFWNVAKDTPMSNTETIQILAIDNRTPYVNPVVFQYIKDYDI
jgi:type IV pilus assembly protein PilV